MQIDSHVALRGLKNGEFHPYFQPLMKLRSGQLEGFEVLSRWMHPEIGMISPTEFIPLAERDGWIGDLTTEMMRRAFKAASALPDTLTLAINISPVQLRDLGLPKRIQSAAEVANIAPKRLAIEITETALSESPADAQAIIRELKAMGCSLALDDFGTGYSSLSTLQMFPFDKLKVDRSFVSSMTERRESRKIVAAVVGLGNSLGLTTIAEGVETQEQAEMLLWLECELAQGWFYGKPVPVEGLADVLSVPPIAVKSYSLSDGDPRPLSLSKDDNMPGRRLAQIRAVYDGAPVGLAFLDTELRYVTVNRRFADMNGVPMEDHLGKTVADLKPELFSRIEPYLLEALHGETVTDLEIKVKESDQEVGRTTLRSYQPAHDEAGEVQGISVAVMDVTELEQEREGRRQSEENYRNLLDLIPQIPWKIDPEGRVLDVSRRWIELTGMHHDEWRDFGWLDALHPDDRQPTMDRLQGFLKGKCPIDLKYRVRNAKSGYRWMHARGSPHLDAAGNTVCWYGSLEEVRLEEVRRQSEEHARYMLNFAGNIPWVLDSEWNAIDVSQRWLEVTGMTGNQWKGHGWLNALHPEDRKSIVQAMHEASQTLCGIEVEYRVSTPHSGWQWMYSRGSARVDSNGDVVCWYGSVVEMERPSAGKPPVSVSATMAPELADCASGTQ